MCKTGSYIDSYQSSAAERPAADARAVGGCRLRRRGARPLQWPVWRRRPLAAQVHALAKIIPPGLRVVERLLRTALAQHLARAYDVAAVGDLQGLAGGVVGDQDRDAVVPQVADDRLDA